MDIRSVVRGVVLQALYELDSTHHPADEVLKFRNDLDKDRDEIRLVGYLALRMHYRSDLGLPSPHTFELSLTKAQDLREPFEQVLIDALTEGVAEEEVTPEHVALIERQVEFPDVEDFDVRLEHTEDILPLASQQQINRLTRNILENRTRLDDIIHRYAPEYPIDQMALVDRNILRLAIYEFGVSLETPLKVAINEAVELAKIFGSESTPRFVNGVLGSLARSHDDILAELAEKHKEEA